MNYELKTQVRSWLDQWQSLASDWQSLHKKGETRLTEFLSAIGGLSLDEPVVEATLDTPGSIPRRATVVPRDQSALAAEAAFQRLLQTKEELSSLFDSMAALLDEAQTAVQAVADVESLVNRGVSGCESCCQDLIDYLMVFFEMHKAEWRVKLTILESLSFTLSTDVLNTYVVVWSVQPHLDSAKADELKQRLEADAVLEHAAGHAAYLSPPRR